MLILANYMINIFSPHFVSIAHGIIYRARFLFNYVIIGFLSVIIELLFQTRLIELGINIYISSIISILIGISFAFIGNIYFNFKIPHKKRNQAFKYFVFISLLSIFIQWLTIQNIDSLDWTYEKGRILISGSVFMVGYLLHKKFSFKDNKKVGVAIYTNGVENLEKIHNCIGSYLDFIHVDIVDSTFKKEAETIMTYRLETIRAYWPNKEIHVHIMSTTPSNYINEIVPFSDVIFIHAEIDEEIHDLCRMIKGKGRKFGVVISMTSELNDIDPFLKVSDHVLLLAIKHPGLSGQKFELKALEKINLLNALSYRHQFSLCVDGGVNEDIVKILDAENIVSGSSVLNNIDPKKQIMRLQTASRYGSI